MKPRTDMRKGAFAVVLAMVLSCGGVAAQGVDALNGVDPGRGFVWADRAYPAMNAEYARVGRPRGLAQVRSVALGQSREELQGILGAPLVSHDDGSWEFQLVLPMAPSGRLICQYRVFFDEGEQVEEGVWRRPQCADLVTGRGR